MILSKYPLNVFTRCLVSCLVLFQNVNAQNGAGVRPVAQNGIVLSENRVKKNHFITDYPDEFFFIQDGLQDKNGNLWFCSAGDGIFYYDGKSFTNFTRNDGLCHNDILCAREDKSGIIWFGTRNGLIRYRPTGKSPQARDFDNILISENMVNPITHQKIPYTYVAADNFVWSIMQDKSGKLWFGTNKGVFTSTPVISKNDTKPSFMRFSEDAKGKQQEVKLKDVTSMLQDKTGKIWFVSAYSKTEGISCFDGKTLKSYLPDSVGDFRKIIQRKNGELLFLSTFKGVYKFNGKTFSNLTRSLGIENDTLISIIEDRAGNLWMGRNSELMSNGGKGGVWLYDGQKLKLFTTKDGLSHNCVFTIVEDKSGFIWFGTRNTGLCRFDGKEFTDFTE